MSITKHDVEVRRIETSSLTISVEAGTVNEAHHLAIDAAADRDYRSEGTVVSVDYEADAPVDQAGASDTVRTVEQKYLTDGGNHCPACGSTEMECGVVQTDGITAWRTVECDDCHAEWQENFILTGISDADGFDPEAPV